MLWPNCRFLTVLFSSLCPKSCLDSQRSDLPYMTTYFSLPFLCGIFLRKVSNKPPFSHQWSVGYYIQSHRDSVYLLRFAMTILEEISALTTCNSLGIIFKIVCVGLTIRASWFWPLGILPKRQLGSSFVLALYMISNFLLGSWWRCFLEASCMVNLLSSSIAYWFVGWYTSNFWPFLELCHSSFTKSMVM